MKNKSKTSVVDKTSIHRFELQDVSEPNLFREYFPYSEVCKTPFTNRIIPPNLPPDFWITDTTFRDGQQARPPYTVEQIVDIYDMLHRLGGPNGVIRQSEFFLYSKKDKEAVTKCLEKGYRFPEVTGWIRAAKGDFKLVKEMGLKETGILTSCSDYHIFLKLNMTRREAMNKYLEIVSEALNEGIIPRCHLEDITRADFYGFVIPFVQELMSLSEKAKMPIKVRACDTMGYGVPYTGAALPRGIQELIYGLINEGGVPSELLEWHGHNDFHKVLINASTAWLYGCAAANGAILGFGERTGNSPIEGLIIEYISLRGENNGIDTTVITEIAEYFHKVLHYHIPPNYPLVGSEFNTTSAGIHLDGVLKNEEIYNIFNTAELLNRPIGITITDKSGLAGVAQWINSHLGFADDKKVDKRHPAVAKIYKWVTAQYENGRLTSISSDEMLALTKRYLPEHFVSELDRLKLKAKEIAFHLAEDIVEKSEFKTMDPKWQEPLMKALLDENPFIQFAYVVDTDGKKTTKNITQVVDKAKYEKIGAGENFSNRDWFIEPMKTGKTYITDFYKSVMTGALCITVSAPIRNIEEEIIGVFGIDIKFEELLKMANDTDLEEEVMQK
ncbi:MAG: histone-lysine N-methyltransferase [Nitrospirae bacterium RBG_19FT_COMBO_42_15]|nr:MAG: histone-lysine N-methyltransferase [Nitrospirae bacterium RBG_19FT_COMBO_42_15]